MKKETILVPNYIRYMSEWKDYQLPQGHCIVDKGVTGCGYTEYCLRNNQNIVLCSPRKLLLENKRDQHKDDQNILYLENDIKNFQGAKSFEDIIKEHIIYCNPPFGNQIPCKILVTYDSCHRVVKALQEMGVLQNFYFVADEFQSMFLDSYFKSNVELDFVEVLQDCPNVIYLSATPMMDKYLDKLDEFKNLPYYELDWSETGVVEKVIIKRKFTTSLTGECSKIIQSYLSGKFEVTLNKDNNVIISTEAVFFLNSIGDITKIIKKNSLTPSQVNIICADTQENKNKLSKLSSDILGDKSKSPERFEVGKIPLKGEPNKMFTFCTKTAYIGSDFHSPNARSFVFADPNISSLALDISLDLPQIVGRQRDDDNPFKNDITIFYRTIRKSEMKDKNIFLEIQKKRKESTLAILRGFDMLGPRERTEYLRKLRVDIKVSEYSEDFVSISSKTGLPVYNTFIELANERAWEVSQEDYQDKINVTKALGKISSSISEYQDESEKIVQDFLDNHFYRTGIFEEKMKMYCEFMDSVQGNREIEDILYYKIKDDRFRKFYNFYGTSGCRSRSYISSKLIDGMEDSTKEKELRNSIYTYFKIGDKYTKKFIKSELEVIYRNLEITSRKPKASDLSKYFTLARIRIPNKDTGKMDEGYKLDSL